MSEAAQRYEEGRVLFAQSQFADAYIRFSQACALQRTINCAKNLGLVEYNLGQYAEATTHLREYFDSLPPNQSVNANVYAAAREVYDQAYARSGHLRVVAPVGAKVTVDGRIVGGAPLPPVIDVAAGAHTIETRTYGTSRQQVQVSVPAGSVLPVTFLSGPPRVASTPREAESSPAKIVITTMMYGFALASAGAGVWFALHAEDKSQGAEVLRAQLATPSSSACTGSTSPVCRTLSSFKDDYDNARRWETIAFIGAGALAVSATATLILWQPSSSSSSRSARFAPLLSPGLAGIGYGGTF
ncbi:hypothetical protein LZC95_08280 [Pendulispora brunnea]|uniref:PEGA domain-containing protein n=1 Tax=Pendulispora brunnea TaxID=2905690 RepID=A0ABZ2KH08_9BACT